MSVRRRTLVLVLGATIMLIATPAFASLIITNRMAAGTQLVTGPQFFAYGSGTTATVGQATSWDGFTLDGLAVDPETNTLQLSRGGLADPSDIAWWDPAWPARVCGVVGQPEPDVPEAADPEPDVPEATDPEPDVPEEPAQVEPEAGEPLLVAFTFDTAAEIEAGRLAADLADLRVIDAATGLVAPHKVTTEAVAGGGTKILVEVAVAGTTLCAYWGNPEAGAVATETLGGPLVADGTWSWERWDTAGNGLSLDLVDWSAADATELVVTSESPLSACDRCATELFGFVIAPTTGTYRFYLSADEVGTLELGPSADQESLAPIVTLTEATAVNDFTSSPSQVSEPVDLVEGQVYAIRARAKDLSGPDHLQIAWATADEAPALVPASQLLTGDSVPGGLTYRRFDVVETVDLSTDPSETLIVTTSETVADSCDLCQSRLGGYVLVEAAGTYRFWLSSDDEGTLWLSAAGSPADAAVPADAVVVASTPSFVGKSVWDTFPTQRSDAFDLVAGQVIWLQATSRDGGGPDHLQVGWSLEPEPEPELDSELDPATDPDPAPTDPVMEAPSPEVALIPGAALSRTFPVPASIAATPLIGVEGLFQGTGTFVSPIVDTTETGSNVHGLVSVQSGELQEGAALTVQLAFAPGPDGPWVPAGPETDPTGSFADGLPVPLAADGQRYARFEGTIATPDLASTPSLMSLGLEYDLIEASSVDSGTAVTAVGLGNQYLLRVKGSAGSANATLQILPSGVLTGLSATTWLEPGPAAQVAVADGAVVQGVGAPVAFGPGQAQHIGINVTGLSQVNLVRVSWVAVLAGGARVSHDLDIAIAP